MQNQTKFSKNKGKDTMTDEQIQEMTKENTSLKNQVQALLSNLQAKTSEIESIKEMLGQQITNEIPLRTNMKLIMQQKKFTDTHIANLTKTVDDLNKQLADANDKLKELQAAQQQNAA